MRVFRLQLLIPHFLFPKFLFPKFLFPQFVILLVLSFHLLPLRCFADVKDCAKHLEVAQVSPLGQVARVDLASAPVGADQLAAQVESQLNKQGYFGREVRGYAILSAAMLASAATATYLNSALPDNFQFLSQFVAQVSTLGVYMMGAPIWEPLSSKFRKLAFGVRRRGGVDASRLSESEGFEQTWRRTQETYSLNAQMSRNLINQFIVTLNQNFFEAFRAIKSGERNYATDQIGEAAVRLRTLFKEISPEDISLANAVRTSFANHVVTDAAFIDEVLKKVEALDPAAHTREAQQFYQRLFVTWFGQSLP